MSCHVLLGDQSVTGIAASAPAVHVELPPEPAAVRTARGFVAEHAGLADPGGPLALLTSELVTNAVLHARTSMTLGVMVGNSRVLVTVADGDAAGRPWSKPPDDERPSGRGIVLVEALAAQWGIFEVDGGKAVWFTLPRDVLESEKASPS